VSVWECGCVSSGVAGPRIEAQSFVRFARHLAASCRSTILCAIYARPSNRPRNLCNLRDTHHAAV